MNKKHIHIDQLSKLWSAFGDNSKTEWALLHQVFMRVSNAYLVSLDTMRVDVIERINSDYPTDSDFLSHYFEQIFSSPNFQEALHQACTNGDNPMPTSGESKADRDKMAFRSKYAIKEDKLKKLRPLWEGEMPAEKLSQLLS
ncbi:MAG: hypothetical protein ACPGJS_11925 [Flammeovirgaceae bacterium]